MLVATATAKLVCQIGAFATTLHAKLLDIQRDVGSSSLSALGTELLSSQWVGTTFASSQVSERTE
jgi:hypothetical protein